MGTGAAIGPGSGVDSGLKNSVKDPSGVDPPQPGIGGGTVTLGTLGAGTGDAFSGWNICVNEAPASAGTLGTFGVASAAGTPVKTWAAGTPANNWVNSPLDSGSAATGGGTGGVTCALPD